VKKAIDDSKKIVKIPLFPADSADCADGLLQSLRQLLLADPFSNQKCQRGRVKRKTITLPFSKNFLINFFK
jgi:hypothetical protein